MITRICIVTQGLDSRCVFLALPHSHSFVISPQRNIVTDNMNKGLLILTSSFFFFPHSMKGRGRREKNQINSTFEQNIIWSTVNNFGGSSLVKSLLWGEKAEGFFFLWAAISLAPGFCLHFHYISTTLSDASILFSISLSLGFNLGPFFDCSAHTEAGEERGCITAHESTQNEMHSPVPSTWF